MSSDWLVRLFSLRFDGSTQGVGDCNHSWGVDGLRGKVWNGDHSRKPYGKSWKNGDRIGCALDIDGKTMGFYINNEYQGDAFTNCVFDGGVYPAFTLSGEGKMRLKVFLEVLPVSNTHLQQDTWKFMSTLTWLRKNGIKLLHSGKLFPH